MLSLASGKIFADGSEYLSCSFLFWGPSEKSKKSAERYENAIKGLYTKLLSRQVSYYVLWYIWSNPKGRTLTYKPWIPNDAPKAIDPTPETPPGLRDAGPYVKATSDRGALIAGSVYRNLEHNFNRMSVGKAPEPDDLSDGSGSDAVVRMTPSLIAGAEGWARFDGPGFHPDEVLFHETIHALDDITGLNAESRAGPAGYDNLEEFTACVISNMYISQENLYNPALPSLLRSGHAGAYDPKKKAIVSDALPAALGFDLRLMSWGDGSGVPTSGNKLVIVGIDKLGLLNIRIFDAGGKRAVDTDETDLPGTQSGAISSLKKQLKGFFPPHVLTSAEKAQVISQVTSIVGQILYTELSVSKAFADLHKTYLKAVADNHRGLVDVYKRMTWVPFNPFCYI
jgi:hypothetical protein